MIIFEVYKPLKDSNKVEVLLIGWNSYLMV
jgi:hypothetical protein